MPVAGFCENGSEPSGSINPRTLLSVCVTVSFSRSLPIELGTRISNYLWNLVIRSLSFVCCGCGPDLR
jgi:hypothetical protein